MFAQVFFCGGLGSPRSGASPQKSNMIHTAGTSTVSGSDQVDAGGVPLDEVAVMHHMHTIRCM